MIVLLVGDAVEGKCGKLALLVNIRHARKDKFIFYHSVES